MSQGGGWRAGSVDRLHLHNCDWRSMPVGIPFPDASAVYFRHWSYSFECDGPLLMFFYAFWYVLGFGGACYSPYWCCPLFMFAKTMRAFENLRAFYEKHESSWAVFSQGLVLSVFIVGVIFSRATVRV